MDNIRIYLIFYYPLRYLVVTPTALSGIRGAYSNFYIGRIYHIHNLIGESIYFCFGALAALPRSFDVPQPPRCRLREPRRRQLSPPSVRVSERNVVHGGASYRVLVLLLSPPVARITKNLCRALIAIFSLLCTLYAQEHYPVRVGPT